MPFPVHATKADLYIKTSGRYISLTVTLVGSPSVTLYGDTTERPSTINLTDIPVNTTATGIQVNIWSAQTPGSAGISTGSYVKVYADD